MGTCACTEQYFFYNINYDDEASQPRISGKKLISSTHSGGGYGSMGMPGSMGSRKHKGANVAGVKKTTSGKSQRVGAAGKKAVAAKVASRAE